MHLVVTISGLHGTGKSTYAKAIAESFNLRHVSAGHLFRKLAEERNLSIEELTKLAGEDPSIDNLIDKKMMEEAERGDVVIDGQLAGWMAKDKANVKIFLTAPERVRIERIAGRDSITLKEAEAQTALRERLEKERYKKYYGIDIEDLSIYDLIVDTSLLPLEETVKTLREIISDYVTKHAGR
jgi:cytidylate kinase